MGNPSSLNPLIHNPDSDSSPNTSESVDLTNLDSTDYGCEIRLLSIVIIGNSIWNKAYCNNMCLLKLYMVPILILCSLSIV